MLKQHLLTDTIIKYQQHLGPCPARGRPLLFAFLKGDISICLLANPYGRVICNGFNLWILALVDTLWLLLSVGCFILPRFRNILSCSKFHLRTQKNFIEGHAYCYLSVRIISQSETYETDTRRERWSSTTNDNEEEADQPSMYATDKISIVCFMLWSITVGCLHLM